MRFLSPILCLTLLAAGPATVAFGQKVAIRVSGAKFGRVVADGSLRADRLLPVEAELFELLPRNGGAIALKAPDGRLLAAQTPDARSLRANSPRSEPGEWETFTIVPAEGNRVGLKARGFREFVQFLPGPAQSSKAGSATDKPGPPETIEIFSVAELPDSMRTMLADTVRTLVLEELTDKQYDKTRTRRTEKFVDLPAPVRENLLRTKKQRVLSVTEEYQIQARLDGKPSLEIKRLPYLKGHVDRGTVRLMFEVHASAPVVGHVRYHVPDVFSVSTGFHTQVRLALSGEVGLRKDKDELVLDPPEVLDLFVELRKLDLSNDLLQTARKPIERLVNDELDDNKGKLRSQANRALAKALKTRQFKSPLLKYLAFP